MDRVFIFDTTLRDGEQSPGCSMNTGEKLEVARTLERLSVDVIEAGFAASSAGDMKAIKLIAEQIKGSTICSLSRCLKADIDAAFEALAGAQQARAHLFLATSKLHMEYKLKMTKAQVLEAVRESVKYAATKFSDIEFSAEDASRSEQDFLISVCKTAVDAGARTINIPDTVGYSTPAEMRERILAVRAALPDGVIISTHCHDDLGLATANSLAAISGGARQVECTINGIGERAGNASLEEIVMALHAREALFGCKSEIDTRQIYRASKLVASITGQQVPPNKAIVGKNAFAHEAGIHQHGVMANRSTYEILSPRDIGIPDDLMVLGKHSGSHAFGERVRALGYSLSDGELETAFAKFKALADRKKTVSDRDIEALLGHGTIENAGAYSLQSFVINSGNTISATARILLDHAGEKVESVELGDGPVDAAFKAINRIVGREFVLSDYQLKSVTEGEDALGEAVVRISLEGGAVVTGRGVSTDIFEASIKAYINGVNKLLADS